jgi:phosphatidylglycerophosphate synthase
MLTPNQVTILSLVAGLSVGLFFAMADTTGLIIGGVLFYVAFVLDCTDGKLARATGITSPKGQALDALADGARRASATLGLALAFWRVLTSTHCGVTGLFRTFKDVPTRLQEAGSANECMGPVLGWHHGLLMTILYGVLAYYFLEISGAEKADPAGGVRGKWSQALAKRRLMPTPGMPDVQAIVFIFGPITGFVVPALYLGIAMVSVGIVLTVIRRLR